MISERSQISWRAPTPQIRSAPATCRGRTPRSSRSRSAPDVRDAQAPRCERTAHGRSPARYAAPPASSPSAQPPAPGSASRPPRASLAHACTSPSRPKSRPSPMTTCSVRRLASSYPASGPRTATAKSTPMRNGRHICGRSDQGWTWRDGSYVPQIAPSADTNSPRIVRRNRRPTCCGCRRSFTVGGRPQGSLPYESARSRLPWASRKTISATSNATSQERNALSDVGRCESLILRRGTVDSLEPQSPRPQIQSSEMGSDAIFRSRPSGRRIRL
ncbi:hypothetical protein QE430_003004 [Microbacterium testaceum]|nr:hypothetical protein [Microbacterium testaceum]